MQCTLKRRQVFKSAKEACGANVLEPALSPAARSYRHQDVHGETQERLLGLLPGRWLDVYRRLLCWESLSRCQEENQDSGSQAKLDCQGNLIRGHSESGLAFFGTVDLDSADIWHFNLLYSHPWFVSISWILDRSTSRTFCAFLLPQEKGLEIQQDCNRETFFDWDAEMRLFCLFDTVPIIIAGNTI